MLGADLGGWMWRSSGGADADGALRKGSIGLAPADAAARSAWLWYGRGDPAPNGAGCVTPAPCAKAEESNVTCAWRFSCASSAEDASAGDSEASET